MKTRATEGTDNNDLKPGPRKAQITRATQKAHISISATSRALPFVEVAYKGHILRGNYRMDFVCFQAVVLEIKARSAMTPADHAQILSYLASARIRHGLLLNFGAAKREHRRFVLNRPPR